MGLRSIRTSSSPVMQTSFTLLLDVFDAIPHVMVCVKDEAGRYVGANQAFARRARQRTATDVIGKRAADLFPAELAASYEAQDRALLSTGQAVRNQLEVIADAVGEEGGDTRWYLTSKMLNHTAEHGTVIIAVSVDARLGERTGVATGLRAAVELAHASFDQPLRVADLAAAAGVSADRLERAMRRVLGISPKQYLIRIRAEHAATLLATTDRSIAEVAAECGYYDQSQLTRQFRGHIGLTPREYRKSARVVAID
jgi:AraC-like DNA-binding protein